jgi:adenosylmethionine---8-amino-7-oxononanoate aminotransferase
MTPRTRALAAADHRHLWHPFTQHDEWIETEPLVIERADGVHLIDTEGRRYLDGVSSLWTNVHGHRVPEIDEAVQAQLGQVAHTTLLGLMSLKSIELAERLAALVPDPLGRVFFSDSGSTATEVALKIAFQCQQQRGHERRTRFAAFQEAYHGDTLGSVSVGGIDLFHEIYRPLLFGAVRFPAPERPDPDEEARCLDAIDRLLEAHGDELAAFIFEPLVQGAAGMHMHSPAFLDRVLVRCRERGLLLVADEVATGFGRTGTMFAIEKLDTVPDVLCLAKGLSGGYLPIAATVTTEAVFESFRGPYDQHRTLFHGHTYTGNPLACAAALASLDLFETRRVLDTLPERIAALSEALEMLPDVVERRQCGLMAGAVLRNPRRELRLGHRVCLAARRHGAIVRPLGDVIVLMPPLAMSPDEIRTLGRAVGNAIVDCGR